MLDLGDFVDVLERDLATDLVAGVHRTAQAILPGLDIGGIQQQVGGGRGPEIEGKRAIGAHGDARRNRNTGIDVCGASIELLEGYQS